MIKVDSILVPVDFSENSLKAARYGAELARKLGSRLFYYHVIHQRVVDSTREMCEKGYKGQFVKVMRSLVESRKDDLAELVPQSWREGLDVELEVGKGKPADEIIKFAKEKHVDLIVVATVGRTGLQAAITGSVATHVLNRAPCPTMVVRPGERDFV